MLSEILTRDCLVASDVCKNFVLYDSVDRNPFRELIPWTTHHLMLLQVIVATSALHMSNATRRPSDLARSALYHRDALLAKQGALCLLKSALEDIGSADVDVTLAVVLLLIQFELIDSGRDEWRHHIKGARAIIERLLESEKSVQDGISPLRGSLISDCLV